MKIQCDVCNKHQASFFCTADEAALCEGCDHRIHHVNKLASKHQRFSLEHPSAKQYPLCDVCLERRAFVFCQQDRAILCKECDLAIHSANEHTKKHHRFLLTGTKLSATATLYSSSSSSPPSPPSNSNSNSKSQSSCAKNTTTVVDSSSNVDVSHPPPLMAKHKTTTPSTPSYPNIPKAAGAGAGAGAGSSSCLVTNEEEGGLITSSISEYLIKTIPGWQVEDFLDSPPSSVPFGFSKNGNDDDMLALFDADIEERNLGGIWVPQAPSSLYSLQMDHQTIGYTKEATNVKASRSRLMMDDNNFIVPQMTPHNINIASKRSRLLW